MTQHDDASPLVVPMIRKVTRTMIVLLREYYDFDEIYFSLCVKLLV